MSNWVLFIIPLLSAIIGWITNKIAIKMLFYPKKSIFGIQGLIPKKRKELAKKIGQVVETELVSNEDLLKKIDQEKIFFIIRDMIRDKIDTMWFSNMLPEELKDNFTKQTTFEVVMALREHASTGNLSDLFNISEIVEDKINSFDLDRLERIIREVAKREFTAIEWFGAILGLIIGFLQLLLFII
jgi:uncharacterized membrane protein YheB (UPF0754 family)